MKTTLKPFLVLSIVFGFVTMMVSGPMAFAQQQGASMEKPAVKAETGVQSMPTSKPGGGIGAGAAQNQKAPSDMTKSTGKMATMSKEEIKSMQEALNKDGYKLSVDGVVGKYTRGAIKDFQKKNDLKVTGAPDTETLAKLNLK